MNRYIPGWPGYPTRVTRAVQRDIYLFRGVSIISLSTYLQINTYIYTYIDTWLAMFAIIPLERP